MRKNTVLFLIVISVFFFATGCATVPKSAEAPETETSGSAVPVPPGHSEAIPPVPAPPAGQPDTSSADTDAIPDEEPVLIEILPPKADDTSIAIEPVPDMPVVEDEPSFIQPVPVTGIADEPAIPESSLYDPAQPADSQRTAPDSPQPSPGVSDGAQGMIPAPGPSEPGSDGGLTPDAGVPAQSPPPEVPVQPEGGIWEYEPTFPYVTDTEPAITDAIQPGRSVTVQPDQYIDVTYPGSGWVYLGDTGGSQGILYYGKKMDGKNTVFTLRARDAGVYNVQFTKQDVLRDTYIDDSLLVTVSGERYTGTGHAAAPAYNESAAVAPAPETQAEQPARTPSAMGTEKAISPVQSTIDAKTGKSVLITEDSMPSVVQVDESTPSSARQTAVPSSSQTSPESVQPAELLKQARAAISSGAPDKALELLDDFFRRSVANLDEGWYLRGQAYEAAGSTKNIRKALDAYQTLVQAYPGSTWWKQAKDRITYINRFYFNIR